jgi:DNA-binding NarL/FixJ family response regulator
MQATRKLRIVLVDDHVVFREGLAALLSAIPDMEVVGQATDGPGALEAVERAGPDVIILDVSLERTSGFDVARELAARWRSRRILVLTMYGADDYAEQALAAGATGFATKSQRPEEIVEAIRRVSRGEPYIARGAAQPLPVPSTDIVLRDRYQTLTNREREVFELVIHGLSNERVALRMCISRKTVETHRARINRKLGLHSTAALVRFAARNGMLTS